MLAVSKPLALLLVVLLLGVATWPESARGATVRQRLSDLKEGASAKEVPRGQVPNYEYIERGFDAMLGNPKTTPQGDLGFRDWIFESDEMVKASRRPGCDFSSHTMDMIRNTELQLSFEQGISVEGEFRGIAFSASVDYKQQENQMRSSKTVIVEATAFCTAWDTWLPTTPRLRSSFVQAINALPTNYDQMAYLRFIQQFGTHYAFSMSLGGRSVLSSYFSADKYSKLVAREININLAVSAKFAVASGKVATNTGVSMSDMNSVESSITNTRRYMLGGSSRENFDDWSHTVPDNPIPVMYSLRPLTELLTATYVATQDQNALSQRQSNLVRALNEYRDSNKGGFFQVDVDFYPTRWPTGSYCLPTQGSCSGGSISGWVGGSRYQDTEDSNGQSYVSADAPAIGGGGGGVTMSFCCHLYSDQHSGSDMAWPDGSYCIFKRGNCPSGFNSGGRYFDDEDNNNNNWSSGQLPDGQYDRNTRYEFCCRQSSQPNIAVKFPIFGEFWLVRKANMCQQVKGMVARDATVYWDDEDSSNHDSSYGTLPDGSYGINTQINFCRYIPLD